MIDEDRPIFQTPGMASFLVSCHHGPHLGFVPDQQIFLEETSSVLYISKELESESDIWKMGSRRSRCDVNSSEV